MSSTALPALVRHASISLVILAAACSDAPVTPPAASSLAPSTGDAQSVVLSGSGTWDTKANLPAAREFAGGAVLQNLLYVVAGSDLSNTLHSDVYAYDPLSDSWTARASLPTVLLWPGVVAYGGKLWVIGGEHPAYTGAVYIYDPVGNSWSNGPSLPGFTYGARPVVCNSKLYVVAGWQGDWSTLLMWNAGLQKWVKKAPQPGGHSGVQGAAGCVGTAIYVTGGGFGGNNLDVYETTTNSWSTIASSPFGPYTSGGVVKGFFYAAGAATTGVMMGYDPTSTSWKQLHLPPSSLLMQAAVVGEIGNTLYMTAGADNAHTGTYAFTPASTGNHAPVPDMGGAHSGTEGSNVSFDGSSSSDPDGDVITTVAWDFGDGGTSTSTSPDHAFAAFGKYRVTLTLTDEHGKSASASQVVAIADAAPVLDVGAEVDTIFRNGAFSRQVSFTDVGANSWYATATYGATVQHPAVVNKTFSLLHHYCTSGTHQAVATIGDHKLTDTKQVAVTVLRVSPALAYVLAHLAAMDMDTATRDTLTTDLMTAKSFMDGGDAATALAWVQTFATHVTNLHNTAALTDDEFTQLSAYAGALEAALDVCPT